MIGASAKRIKKMNEVFDLMEGMCPIVSVEGHEVAPEAIAAADIGIAAGFHIATLVAEGKCDDMGPMEIATRLYDTALGLFVENVVLAESKEEQAEEEAEHAEE